MRDVATSTTRLALSQSTRSRTNRVWHWRTLRRCRRGMIRMIQAAAHPRTPASIPLLPRPTRTRPGTRLQTLRLPSPRTRTNRTRILRPSERVSQLQAAGGGGGRRAAAGDGGRQGPPLLRPGLPRTCGDRRIREVTPAGFIIRHIYHGTAESALAAAAGSSANDPALFRFSTSESPMRSSHLHRRLNHHLRPMCMKKSTLNR